MMKKSSHPVSHHDIAARINVAQSTVSRALDPKKRHLVAPATLEKILEAAEELGFRPNIYARRMRSLKSDTLTLIIDDINISEPDNTGGLYARGTESLWQVICGIIDAATENGFDIKMLPLHSRREVAVEELVSHIGYPFSDGVLCIGFYHMQKVCQALKTHNLPGLIIYPLYSAELPLPAVTYDLESGISSAIEALVEKGHRKIAICSHKNVYEDDFVGDRFKVYKKTLEKFGLFDDSLILVTPDTLAIRHMAQEVDCPGKFSAMFCVNDVIAATWMNELKYRGLQVPEDIAVVGFDNSPQYPNLSTVNIPRYAMGQQAVSMMIKMIKSGKPASNNYCFNTEYIHRHTD
jgi:DNA-binding LacI/PurR family transcriptional regulator